MGGYYIYIYYIYIIYFKMQDFLMDISLLIVFLFEKQINRLFIFPYCVSQREINNCFYILIKFSGRNCQH